MRAVLAKPSEASERPRSISARPKGVPANVREASAGTGAALAEERGIAERTGKAGEDATRSAERDSCKSTE